MGRSALRLPCFALGLGADHPQSARESSTGAPSRSIRFSRPEVSTKRGRFGAAILDGYAAKEQVEPLRIGRHALTDTKRPQTRKFCFVNQLARATGSTCQFSEEGSIA